jgi:predicted MFS family arabinose efflux permease
MCCAKSTQRPGSRRRGSVAHGGQDASIVRLRSWVASTIVIAVIQGILALLLILQHDAIYSDLLHQRVSVVAQTTAASFRPIIDLGLPISMIRDGDAIVARGPATDPEIRSVRAVNPSGIVVYTSPGQKPATLEPEVLQAMQLAGDVRWSAETGDAIHSGFNIVPRAGATAGAVVVTYPKDRLNAASRAIRHDTVRAALLIWAAASAIAFVLLHLLLAPQQRSLACLGRFAGDAGPPPPPAAEPGWRDALFDPEVERLAVNLRAAEARFETAEGALAALAAAPDGAAGAAPVPDEPAPHAETVATDPSRSLAGQIAAGLAPAAAGLIIASALVLGAVVLRDVNRSIEPELAARTNLIGTVVGENVQRALDTGVPLDNLVGAEAYFGDMLRLLPEVAYIAVATGRIVLEAGERIDPYLAPPRERKDVRSHPIMHDGEEVAYVVIDIDPRFIAKRFRDVFLDVGVVVLVTVLLAYEIMLLLTSRSLTAGLDRLQRLAAMQAAGDFSRRVVAGGRGAIGRVTRVLVDRAEALHRQYAVLWAQRPSPALALLRDRYGLSEGRPALLRLSYFTDIRLALFLFSAADELPLSSLPLYTRAADNLWPWLDKTVLISLPLAGYLLAILLASPYSRTLVERFGVRNLFVLAALPNIVAHLGLYFAGTAQEIILWRTVTGFGYAFVTLAAQDYVIDVTPPAHRDRTLGLFTLVLFGGALAGVALGGVLADRLGQRNVFLLSAGLIAASVALSARLIPPAVRGAEARDRPRLADMLGTLRDRRFAAMIFGLAIPAGITLQAFASYLAALTLDSLGVSTADIGRILTMFMLAVVAAGPLGGRLASAGVPVGPGAFAGAVLAGLSLLPVAISPGVPTMALAVLAGGLGHGLVRGAQVSMALGLAEADPKRFPPAVVLGALRALERLGSIVGLVLVATFAGYAGYAPAIGAVALWLLAGAALFALVFLPRYLTTREPAE